MLHSMDTLTKSSMGVDLTWLRAGSSSSVKVMVNLPIKGELTVDPTDSKVSVKYDPPTQRTQLIRAWNKPNNFFVYMPLPQNPFHYELTYLYGRENMRHVTVEVGDFAISSTRKALRERRPPPSILI